LVRPSYVIGGRAMEVVWNESDLRSYMRNTSEMTPDRPLLVDKYITGKEAEVDVISDGVDCLLPGIMEHIERAGVHSGDSMAVYPPQTLSQNVINQIEDYAIRMAKALEVKGLMNIQYVIEGDQAYIIEVNPRASRTVPYLSKITGIPMVTVATQVMLGATLKELGYTSGLYPLPDQVAVKAPVFSFQKLTMVDTGLGPEMKSTGEIMGVDNEFPRALYKAMVASGYDIPLPGHKHTDGSEAYGAILVTFANHDKAEAAPIVKGFAELGFKIYATSGTAQVLADAGVESEIVHKIREEAEPNLMTVLTEPRVDLLLNTPERERAADHDGLRIRRAAVEHGIPSLTSLDTAQALLTALQYQANERVVGVRSVQDYAIVER
jgi:carbamoyl-phosphate synthase large subunit